MPKKIISNEDITQLKGADRIRLKPGVMLGSDGIDAVIQTVFEIVSNSIDEAKEGYGDLINITLFNDDSVEVEDFGRGIPLDFNNKEQRYNWELIFCELYAGGKYNNNSDSGNYQFAIGTNGLGACATQYTSEYMNVRSYRDGVMYSIDFREGYAVTELSKTELSRKEKRTGTVIKWRPDLKVFTDIKIPRDALTDIIRKQAIVNAGLRFRLRYEQEDGTFEENDYYYEEGIREYLRELAGDSVITQPVFWQSEGSGRDREDKPDYKVKFEMTFCFTKGVGALQCFHNSSFLENGGSPEKAVRMAFTSAIDKYAKTVGKAKPDMRIPFSDIADSLVIIVNSFSTYCSYENQTKKSINNKFIYDFLNNYIKRNLEIYFLEKPQEADTLYKQIIINKKSREAAEAARANIVKELAPATADITKRIDKFVPCRSHDPGECELFIVEGDSALGSCKLARDPYFQAVMPVRGKTLNCLKSTDSKILQNQIIMDLVKVLGCGAEIKVGKKGESAFNITNLRFHKIIICTDADVDGFQIRTLILTMFYRLLPTLISEGYIYIAESPLYEITCGKETEFAYDDNEKAEILKKYEGKKVTIQRSKGLGENEPDMMKLTTMSPATRRLIRVQPCNTEETYEMFDTLLGNNLEARKEFISAHSEEYYQDADI
ncbi:MAG: DNA topoisomerase [Clostridia bacterium]|nr:DNA topoisomerase [Clostridia bacterium]